MPREIIAKYDTRVEVSPTSSAQPALARGGECHLPLPMTAHAQRKMPAAGQQTRWTILFKAASTVSEEEDGV
eukprot:1474266-Pleurochrysis_carterae.AAC.6